MTIHSSKSTDELHAIIKSTVIESFITPLTSKETKELFFGTISKNTYKLAVLPENQWFKTPKARIIISVDDHADFRTVKINHQLFDRKGIYLAMLGTLLAAVGLITALIHLVFLSVPIVGFGLFRIFFTMIAYINNRDEAQKKIAILKLKITNTNHDVDVLP